MILPNLLNKSDLHNSLSNNLSLHLVPRQTVSPPSYLNSLCLSKLMDAVIYSLIPLLPSSIEIYNIYNNINITKIVIYPSKLIDPLKYIYIII